jgi:hypothetical protein
LPGVDDVVIVCRSATSLDWTDFLLLGAVTLVAIAIALIVFPRRDLGAPS